MLTFAQHEKWGKAADRLSDANPTHKVSELVKALKSEINPSQIEAHALLCELMRSSQTVDTLEGLQEYYEHIDHVRNMEELKDIPKKKLVITTTNHPQ